MPSGKVIVDNRFHQLKGEFDREIQRALVQAAGVTIATARAAPSKYNIAAVRAPIHATPVRRTTRGYEIDVVDPDFRALFFEKGTYQKLGRVLTRRSKAGHEGNRGVRPQRFMRKGLRAGRISLLESLRRTLT